MRTERNGMRRQQPDFKVTSRFEVLKDWRWVEHNIMHGTRLEIEIVGTQAQSLITCQFWQIRHNRKNTPGFNNQSLFEWHWFFNATLESLLMIWCWMKFITRKQNWKKKRPKFIPKLRTTAKIPVSLNVMTGYNLTHCFPLFTFSVICTLPFPSQALRAQPHTCPQESSSITIMSETVRPTFFAQQALVSFLKTLLLQNATTAQETHHLLFFVHSYLGPGFSMFKALSSTYIIIYIYICNQCTIICQYLFYTYKLDKLKKT